MSKTTPKRRRSVTSRRRYPVTCSMTVEQAADILETYGSGDDPIIWHGVETTPREFANSGYYNTRASRIRIRYSADGLRNVEGSLRDMVFERMDLRGRVSS
jgi:hypothetical protein